MPEIFVDFQPLGSLFRLNGQPVFPALEPKAEFHHHSLPAWDATGRPAVELGNSIESNKVRVDEPAVLVSKLNPRKPRVAVVEPRAGEQHCASTEFMCFIPRSPKEDLQYWAYYLGSGSFSARLQRVAIGSTNSHTRANPSEVMRWEVPNPPAAHKRRIAQILATLDSTIRQTEAIIEKLKQVKQGLLHDLLTRGIDANGELRPPQSQAPDLYKGSPLGWIPKEWVAIRMVEAIRELGQGWSPDCPPEQAAAGRWGVLRTTSIVWDGYTENENKALPVTLQPRPELEVAAGDILITRAGPKARVAVVAYVAQTRPMLMISDKMYRLRLHETELPEYFALALSSHYSQAAIARTISGMADSQTNISQPVIRMLKVMRPPIEEQRAIAMHAAALAERMRTEQEQLRALGNLKSGLMEDLLTGRVRVTPLLAAATPA